MLITDANLNYSLLIDISKLLIILFFVYVPENQH